MQFATAALDRLRAGTAHVTRLSAAPLGGTWNVRDEAWTRSVWLFPADANYADSVDRVTKTVLELQQQRFELSPLHARMDTNNNLLRIELWHRCIGDDAQSPALPDAR
jgi:hypothetical protein